MKLRLEPITAIIVSVIFGSLWYKMTNEPVCYVHESINGKTVEVPVLCKEVENGWK